MQLIKEDVEKKPFHIHGESGVVGDTQGKVVEFLHEPKSSVSVSSDAGDKYVLHNHRPFAEPFSSSASEPDHQAAAESYLEFGNKAKEYLTNGKDVLQIHPASMELIRLHPDPELEETLGKFPEAFKVPPPRDPPKPFANHEAPATFKDNWRPPAGWAPPENYPRG
jgi:hypothetical protein